MSAKKTLSSDFFSKQVQQVGWIDIHTHLNFLEISPEKALEEAKRHGLHHVITIGTEPKDWPVVLELVQKHGPRVYGTLGLHPHEGQQFTAELETYLRQHLPTPGIVAVGEIGLDYYYNNSPREDQLKAFRAQMELAEEFNMPVEIHTRDAEEDTKRILREFDGRVRGVIHCFTGTQDLADVALSCGYNISFSGIVTFKKADELQEVCRKTPLDRLHVETDAPFLAPTPLRGQKNQPDFMLWTAQFVADLKQVPLLRFCQQMKANAQQLFPRLSWAAPVDSVCKPE